MRDIIEKQWPRMCKFMSFPVFLFLSRQMFHVPCYQSHISPLNEDICGWRDTIKSLYSLFAKLLDKISIGSDSVTEFIHNQTCGGAPFESFVALPSYPSISLPLPFLCE